METSDAHSNREMIAHWKRVGPELDRIRRRELRKLNHEEYFAVIDTLLQLGWDYATPRTTSGLVELQRLFAKARR
jgi:hypothetical protein